MKSALPWLAWPGAVVFGLLSLLHVYWALGGRRGAEEVIPEKNGKPLFRPGTVTTLIVAGLLAVSALLVLERAIGIPGILPQTIRCIGTWGVAATLLLRAIGEFNYIGISAPVNRALLDETTESILRWRWVSR